MKALQLHYTSCRYGRAGNPGFQIRALSDGISSDEQRELERRGAYHPPRNANPEPDAEEIERNFPKALRFCTLESGRRALVRSRYVGQDYSGRWGNFFAHSLVLDKGDLDRRWSIDFYEWPGWCDGLAAGEDRNETPPPLEPVDGAHFKAAESFSLSELQAFLAEAPRRAELLARMARAVLLGQENSRVLVVRDEFNEGLYWIACLQKLFSPKHAQELSFSTYQYDRSGCAMLNATTSETGFGFSEAERRYQFYMFDLTTGQHSEVPDCKDDYPATAARWLAENPERLRLFFDFMNHFEHRTVSPDLVSALHLFELSSGSRVRLDDAGLRAMIDFATRHGKAEAREILLDVVAEALRSLGTLPRAEDYEVVLPFLAEGAQRSGEKRHREVAMGAFRALVLHHLASERGVAAATASWDNLRNTLSSYDSELARGFLEPSFQSQVKSHLGAWTPEALLFLVRVAWWCLDQVGRQPPWEQSEIEGPVSVLLSGDGALDQRVHRLLAVVPFKGEILAKVAAFAVSMVARRSPKESKRILGIAVGQALARIFEEVPDGVAALARRHLDQEKNWEILFGEWMEILESTHSPRAAFETYREAVLRKLPGYVQHHRSQIASALLEHLDKPRRQGLALDWLKSREIDQLSDALARRFLDLANRAVALDVRSREASETARLVAGGAERLSLSLAPDRPFLLGVLKRVEDRSPTGPSLRRLSKALAKIENPEYKRFLEGFLPSALAESGSRENHGELLCATVCSEHLEIFRKVYRGYFKAQRGRRWHQGLQGALDFWLRFEPKTDEEQALLPLAETARDDLAWVLSRVSSQSLKQIEAELALKRMGMASWREIEQLVERKKNTPWRRLVRFVTTKTRNSDSGEEKNHGK